MNFLHPFDIGIIVAYVVAIIFAGFYFSKRAAQGVDSYFLGGRQLPWYLLGVSNASGMFDITGTMWTVGILFMYGLKSVFLPWVWPSFNQIFLMIFLAAWMRRSRALTGAEWLATRFSPGTGREASHLATVFYALVMVVGMIAYAFIGIGKFAAVFLPWELSANTYALIILSITTLYVTAGGMYGVVLTDLVQFVLMTIVSIWVGTIAIRQVSAEQIDAAVPEGWKSLLFGQELGIDWSGHIEQVQTQINSPELALYQAFGAFFMVAVINGVLKSMAGPAPGYDMQRILACRNSREASFMSGMITPILMLPRYFMVAGITVLALVNFNDALLGESNSIDFEQVLPFVIREFMPVGLVGLVLAGLLAAFMSTFDSTVNSGAAYLVNDIYKRYINRNSTARSEITMSYLCSIGVVVLGIGLGLHSSNSSNGAMIDTILMWVTVGLGGGYIAPNVLKWYWWRLNGAGYFAGMISGTFLAILQNALLGSEYAFLPAEPMHAFPIILATSFVCTIVVSWLTPPDSDETLKSFYRSVRPWGFWGPIYEKCRAEQPDFQRNTAFGRDMFNCLIGTIWQTAMVVLPIYIVIRESKAAIITLAIIVVTTGMLKFNWFDKLEPATED